MRAMSNPVQATREDVKRLAVYKQGLHQRPKSSGQAELKRIIARIGLLQLDSISVIARSHYLVMLARAGLYQPADLDDLLTDGFLFESWAHAACQIPMAHYPYFHAFIQQKQLKETRWHIQKLGDDVDVIIEQTLSAIRGQGPMSSKDFKSERRSNAGWWNWKPAKVALEYLFDRGELMIAYRQQFRRYYDLSERVLADKNLKLDKTLDDYQRWTIERGLRHIGIAAIDQIADYYRQPKRRAAAIIDEMQRQGNVEPVKVRGWKEPAWIHRDDMPLLDEIKAGQHAPQMTLFLSPFDNLFWHRGRDKMLWDFHYRIEVYTPKPKRVYGYYVMPILHGGELVGRIDPKLERKDKRLIFHALHLEDKTQVTPSLTQGLIDAIREFMAFHQCETFELRQCQDQRLKRTLQKHFA